MGTVPDDKFFGAFVSDSWISRIKSKDHMHTSETISYFKLEKVVRHQLIQETREKHVAQRER